MLEHAAGRKRIGRPAAVAPATCRRPPDLAQSSRTHNDAGSSARHDRVVGRNSRVSETDTTQVEWAVLVRHVVEKKTCGTDNARAEPDVGRGEVQEHQ